jgi:type IV pilus assembly protein PilB
MALRRKSEAPTTGRHAGAASSNGSPNGHGPSSNGNGHGSKATATAAVIDLTIPEQPKKRDDGRMLLGEIIVQQKLVTAAALAEVLQEQPNSGRRLGAHLLEMGLLDEEQLAEVLAEQMGLPIADLREQAPEPDALALVSETIAREQLIVPLIIDGDVLHVATAEPNEQVLHLLAKTTGKKISLYVAPRGDVISVLNRSYRALADIDRHIDAFTKTERARPGAQVTAVETAPDSPVVQVVNKVITQALRDRASDIHIEPQDASLRIRYRIDGSLHDALALPAEIGQALVSRIKILAGMNIVERRRPQDGQISMNVDGRDIDIRVATTSTIWGETCVMRLLDKNKQLLMLDDLGMPSDIHEQFAKLIQAPFGMVLCAGPTGSGKTTTLYAALAEINQPHRNIMTIEDPVEYVLPSINQIQTNDQAGVTFATGLKSILRQDPDVILVGESRDVETARIAVQSALTGHFVLSSLHATDAVAALHRFLDMGIESFLIASSVAAVVGQRLVRRTCTYCKVAKKPTIEELGFFAEYGGGAKRTFYAGAGCNFCSGTGYLDRIGVYEFLRVTPEIRRLVVGWATQEELRRMAVSQGMRTLQEEALDLVRRDVTTISEVVRSIYAF